MIRSCTDKVTLSSPVGKLGCCRTLRRVATCRDARKYRFGGVRCSTAIRVARCRDARLVRPLCQRLQRRGFNGNGRTSRASLQPLLVLLYYNGRTSRASLQPLHVGESLYVSPTEDFSNSSRANEISLRSREMKVRKNEMKLRKKQIKVPKNFLMPPWRVSFFSVGDSDFPQAVGYLVPSSGWQR